MKVSVERQILQALDEQVSRLDGATLSRLGRARRSALAEHAAAEHRRTPWWVAGLGMALAMALLLVGYLGMPMNSPILPVANALQDEQHEAIWQILTLDVDLELVEDLDFYRWLDEEWSMEGV